MSKRTRTQLKEESPLHVIEATGTAYDPTTQHLDLRISRERLLR